MAKATAEIPLPATAANDDSVSPIVRTENDDVRSRLDELLEQFAAEAGYRVYLERIESDGKAAYLGPVPLDDQFLETVRGMYGGGNYEGKIHDQRSKYSGRFPRFRIAGAPRDPNAQPSPAERQAQQPESIGTVLMTMFAGLQESIDRLRETRQATPQPDPLAQFQQFANLYKELSPKPERAPTLKEQLESVNEMLGIKERLDESRGGGGGGVSDAIRELGPLVKEVLSSRGGEGMPTVQQHAPQHDTTARATGPAVAAWLAPFMAFRGRLVALADGNANASLYAALIVDGLSEPQAAAIVTAIEAGTFEKDLFAAVPELHSSPERRRFAGALLDNVKRALVAPKRKRKAAKRSKPGASNV